MTKILSYILAASLSFNLVFGFLSYKFYGEKTEAVSQLDSLQKANEALDESVKKQETACKIADDLAKEWFEEVLQKDKEKDSFLEQIDKLQSVPKQAIKGKKEVISEKATISLDEPLPDELVRVLSEVHNSVPRQGSSDAR